MSSATSILVASAVVAGLLAGLVRRGRLRNLANLDIHWAGLLALAAAIHVYVELAAPASASELSLIASGFTLLFAARNLHLVGMSIVIVGLSLNIAGVVLNRGTSVDRSAAVSSGLVDTEDADVQLDIGGRHLHSPDDRAPWLGEVVPLAPLHDVVSFGDLVAAIGVLDLAFRATFRRGARRHATNPSARTGLVAAAAASPPPDDQPVIDLDLLAEASQRGYAAAIRRPDELPRLHPLHVPRTDAARAGVSRGDRASQPDPSTTGE